MFQVRNSAILLTLFFSCGAYAAEVEVDLGKFTQELQFSEKTDHGFRLIWWIPTEFWRESFRQSKMTQEQKDAFAKTVDDYTIVAVIDGDFGPFAKFIPHGREEVRKNLYLKTGQGVSLEPLPEDDVSGDVRNLLSMMKPVIGGMLGDFGKGTEMICFKGRNDDGSRVADPLGDGWFTVVYGDKEYKWRLPIGNLLPPVFDPDSGERFPGSYIFNPYNGKKLVGPGPAVSPAK